VTGDRIQTRSSTIDRHRYAYLDGIRGVAAILVLVRHTGNFWHFGLYRSYLAVDLFFVLSGFVIAYAYDEKLREGKISTAQFVKIRLIRLYPVFLMSVFMCALVVTAGILFDPPGAAPSVAEIVPVIALTALYLPSRLSGSNDLFPLNGIYWSLFFELLINVVYAAVRRYLNTAVLLVVALSFGLAVALIAYAYGALSAGFTWGFGPIFSGFTRAAFGIFLGLLLFRLRGRFISRFGGLVRPWFAFFLVCALLASPSAGRFDAIVDWLAVALVFPLSILFASRPLSSRFEGLLLTLGSASYPIYVFHRPVGILITRAAGAVVNRHAPFSGVTLVIFLVFFSVWLERRIDIPVRRWLTDRYLRAVKNN
jgi:peptidoglycan/LPS O-acetylase OafA/YrhL